MYSNGLKLPTETIPDITWEDHIYPSPELQIKWRIEDLLNRLKEITNDNYGLEAHYYMGCRFSEEDLRFSPPECFSRQSDIMRAIELAEDELAAIDAEEAAAIEMYVEIGNPKTVEQHSIGDSVIPAIATEAKHVA